MATYKYDGKQWIGYNEFDTALEIVQKSKNNILYLESLHDSGMIEEELQELRNQLNEVRTELASLEMRTESIEETLPLKQDELSAGLAIGIYGTTIAVKLQDIATKLDSVPTGAAITTSSADLIRVENKLYYKTETSVGGMTTYAYEELTNSELTERIVAQIPTDFKIDESGRLILVHDGNVIGAGVEIGGIGVTIDAPATATQGTLTATQLGILEASETNYIMFNHEKYYLMDKQHTSGSLTYSHVGADNQINHIKTFTITLSNLTWVLIDTEVGKSEPAITIVEELPEANENNFEKGKIYTQGELLRYIAKVPTNTPNLVFEDDFTSHTPYNNAAIIYNGKLYIAGGNYDGVYTQNIYEYDLQTKELKTLPVQFPRPLIAMGVAARNNYIFFFGGKDPNNNGYKNIYKLDINNVTLTTLTVQLPYTVGVNYIKTLTHGDNIYLIGGEGATIANLYKFLPTTETIVSLAAFPVSGVSTQGVAIYNNYLYLFGGRKGTSVYNNIYKYNISENSFSTLSITLPVSLSGIGAGVLNDKIYLFGGRTSSAAVSTIYEFNPITETLTTLPTSLPVNAGFIDVTKVNESLKLYFINYQIYEFDFDSTFQYKTITAQ